MDSEIIIQRIIEKTGMSYDDVQRKILNKQQELSNLVSKDGAAYIIAKELGLDLFEKSKKRLEVKNVVAGIKNLNINARIFRIFPAREFEHSGRKSKVANIILADQTGRIRMSLWDTQLKILDEIKEGQAIEVFGAYTRDNNGVPEIRLSRNGGIKVLETSDITLPKQEIKRVFINQMSDGETYEVRAAIVQIFDTNLIYEICPTCKIRIKKDGDAFVCKTHGNVKPDYLIVLNGVIDDGSDNIRAVLFRENALKVMGMSLEQLLASGEFKSANVLGKEFIFTGSIRKNKLFNKDEFVINDVKDVNVKGEVNKIMNSMRGTV